MYAESGISPRTRHPLFLSPRFGLIEGSKGLSGGDDLRELGEAGHQMELKSKRADSEMLKPMMERNSQHPQILMGCNSTAILDEFKHLARDGIYVLQLGGKIPRRTVDIGALSQFHLRLSFTSPYHIPSLWS